MTYASWSVVFGEQPSAAKWNILGTNGAHFYSFLGDNLAWQTWTPTLSGLFNNAKWTKASTYTRVGNTVFFKLLLTASTTTPMDGAGNSILTLPVTSISYGSADVFPLAQVMLGDTGTNDFLGYLVWSSTTTATVRMSTASTAVVSKGTPTSTAPFTWTTGDVVAAIGFYEAA